MQPAFLCAEIQHIKPETSKRKFEKRKELKKMNNEYEHMEEKTQEGVYFQWDESHEDIVDMNVEAGIKIVEFPSNIRMSKTEKAFPDVEELVIANNAKNILIPNTLFPNVKKITSHSFYFVSGKYLVKKISWEDVCKTAECVLHV